MSTRPRTRVTVPQVAAVLAIVGFVAAVLFPLFHHPNYATLGSCASNMKQISIALIEYVQDTNGAYPAGVDAAGNGWAGQLYPVTRSAGVYRCPGDAQKGAFVSYAENRNLVNLPASELTDGARTVGLYEFTTLNCDPATAETVSATGLSAPRDSRRHNADTFGLNFALADGHVKFLTPGQVSGGPSAVRAKGLPSGKVMETFAVK